MRILLEIYSITSPVTFARDFTVGQIVHVDIGVGLNQFYCANFQGLNQYFAWRLHWKIPLISTIDILHQLGVKLRTFLELFLNFSKRRESQGLKLLCLLQDRLRPLPVQTQVTQHLELFIQIYCIFSLKFISYKTMSIIQIVTLDITQLNVHNHIKKIKNTWREKTAEAVILQNGSTITEKEQLLCNTH